jgi:hypothetical protein
VAREKGRVRVLSSAEKTTLIAELESTAGESLPNGLRNAIQNAADAEGIVTALKQTLKHAKRKRGK